jgi:DNA-binding transcriptional LysR family regulator
VAERIVDLVDEGFDLAIRIGRVGSDQLVARKLGETTLMVCAAPAYIERRGAPRRPEDLAGHDTLTYAYAPSARTWQLFDAAGAAYEVRAGGSLHANSGDMLIAAAVAGLGIVCEPDLLLEPELRAGRLVPLLPGYLGRRADIWAVYPTRRHLSVKVRLLVDHLAAYFQPAAAPQERGRRGTRHRPAVARHKRAA